MKCVVCRKSFIAKRADALTCSGRCRMKYLRWLTEITPPWPEGGPFDLFTVDLPLRWTGWSPKGEGHSPQRHYPTIEPPSLIRLLRPMLAGVIAKHCISAWWVYGPRLPDTLRVIRECGFTFTTELFAWEKEGGFGTGLTTRKGIENMWGAKRGKGVPICDHSVDQRVFAPRGEHSQKPDSVYRCLERLYGNVKRLELFGTKLRPGWTVWGHVKGSEFVARLEERGLL